MPSADPTKGFLKQLLADMYTHQAKGAKPAKQSYLIAQDDQFLGSITKTIPDKNSILNPYGPFGSQYSRTSIFNAYSPYGSAYGAYSVNNPYCATPPKLFLKGRLKLWPDLKGRKTANPVFKDVEKVRKEQGGEKSVVSEEVE